jgi:hypothetical protein
MIAVVNGKEYDYGIDVKSLVRDLTLKIADHVPYQDIATARGNMSDLLGMFVEGLTTHKDTIVTSKARSENTRLITSLSNLRESVIKTKDTGKLLQKVYDTLLRLEGLNTLPGFGFQWTIATQMVGNPEKITMRQAAAPSARKLTKGGK